MKKNVIISAILTITLLFGSNLQTKALSADTGVPLDKEWKIKFNSAIDASSVNKNRIYITDAIDQKFDVDYSVDGNTLTLKHDGRTFNSNEKYTIHVQEGIRDVKGRTFSNEITKDFITTEDNNTSKQVIDLDLKENRIKYNVAVGGKFRIDPFLSGYTTKGVYVTSVADLTTGGIYTIPDNVVFKKTLNVYRYVQPCITLKFTDFMMPIKDTEYVGKEIMTYSKEKPYWTKEFVIETATIGKVNGLCFMIKDVTEKSKLDDGQYMDGGFNPKIVMSVGSKGNYFKEEAPYIPWDLVDKDYNVKKYLNGHYNINNDSQAQDTKYTYKQDNTSDTPGIYKVDTATDEKTMLAEGNGQIYCMDKDYIYYTVSTDDYKLNRMKKDGTDKTYLGVDNIRQLEYDNGWFYFTVSRSRTNMFKMRLDGSQLTPIGSDLAEDYMNVYDGYIYYQNYSDNNKLYRIKTDGTDKQKLSDLIKMYDISLERDHIYYRDDNAIYKMDLDGSNVTKP